MANYRPNDSRHVLATKSRIAQAMQSAPKPKDVLIIDDLVVQSERLAAMLRGVFGFDTQVRFATTLNAGIQAVLKAAPDVIFLDDNLKPADTATRSIPKLRAQGFQGGILVISAEVEVRRSRNLVTLGAGDVIHRDDLNGARICQAWLKLCGIDAEVPIA